MNEIKLGVEKGSRKTIDIITDVCVFITSHYFFHKLSGLNKLKQSFKTKKNLGGILMFP